MQISIYGTPGDYWIQKDSKHYGPFRTVLDASFTALEMVTDQINSDYLENPAINFLNPKVLV